MARLRNGWYALHTKSHTVWTMDKNTVNSALNTGKVQIYRKHKDGYLRTEYRKLHYVECIYGAKSYVAETATAKA
jgi:hypothetical protein